MARHKDLLKDLIDMLADKGAITTEEQIRLSSRLY